MRSRCVRELRCRSRSRRHSRGRCGGRCIGLFQLCSLQLTSNGTTVLGGIGRTNDGHQQDGGEDFHGEVYSQILVVVAAVVVVAIVVVVVVVLKDAVLRWAMQSQMQCNDERSTICCGLMDANDRYPSPRFVVLLFASDRGADPIV